MVENAITSHHFNSCVIGMGAGGASHMITCLLSLSDSFRRENIQTGLSRHEGYSNSLFSPGEQKSI